MKKLITIKTNNSSIKKSYDTKNTESLINNSSEKEGITKPDADVHKGARPMFLIQWKSPHQHLPNPHILSFLTGQNSHKRVRDRGYGVRVRGLMDSSEQVYTYA